MNLQLLRQLQNFGVANLQQRDRALFAPICGTRRPYPGVKFAAISASSNNFRALWNDAVESRSVLVLCGRERQEIQAGSRAELFALFLLDNIKLVFASKKSLVPLRDNATPPIDACVSPAGLRPT